MIEQIVEKYLVPGEEFVFGFANLQHLLHQNYSVYNYGISIGKRLDNTIVDSLKDGPTLEYLHHYSDINRQLAEITWKIHKDLDRRNIKSLPIIPTISLRSAGYEKYLESLSYDVSHKMVATRAGIGWIGKTDLLISEKFGPRVRLVTILLEEDPGCTAKPVERSRCGRCNICVKKCPAKAANGLSWDTSIHRDKFFNAFRCREKCGELAKELLGVDERICGLCISVCPIGSTRKINEHKQKGDPLNLVNHRN